MLSEDFIFLPGAKVTEHHLKFRTLIFISFNVLPKAGALNKERQVCIRRNHQRSSCSWNFPFQQFFHQRQLMGSTVTQLACSNLLNPGEFLLTGTVDTVGSDGPGSAGSGPVPPVLGTASENFSF